MGRRKCVCCGRDIEGDEPSVPYKGRYAHEECFNIAIKIIHDDKTKKTQKTTKRKKPAVPASELKDKLSEQEYQEKKAYYDYVKSLLQETNLPAKIYAVSETYLKKYPDFSFKSMHQTLIYLHEIAEKDLTGDVIGIIPYYHEEAQQYFQSVEKVKEENKKVDVKEMYHEKVVQIQPKNLKKKKLIDIEGIV